MGDETGARPPARPVRSAGPSATTAFGADRRDGWPRYVAIITDGNGRWAQRRGLPVLAGHEAGTDTVKRTLRAAADFGIEQLTTYSFSTENWSRSIQEVSGLMSLFERRITREAEEMHAEGVRIRFVGRREAPGTAVPGGTDRMV